MFDAVRGEVKLSDEEIHNEEIDWTKYGEPIEEEEVNLEKMDYLALFIASLQTIFLPFILFTIILLAIGIAIGVLWR